MWTYFASTLGLCYIAVALSLKKISSTAFYHSPENYKIMTESISNIQIWTWIHFQYCLKKYQLLFVVLLIVIDLKGYTQ